MPDSNLYSRVQEARDAVVSYCDLAPEYGIILGTGLTGLAREVEDPVSVPFSEIPHFPQPAVVSHGENLILGHVRGKPVAALEGRCHYYEGYSLEEVTLPVRVLRALGCDKLIVSNACGGLRTQHRKGDLMIIDDHINLMLSNPLIGPNDDRLGPRFPDMVEPYDRVAIELAERIALENGIRVHKGVYAALSGPCLETRAEYRMLQVIGTDVIGMSTVPEVIVAVHSGLRTFGISCITDLCLPDTLKPVDIDEIISVAESADPQITRLVSLLIERWA